MADLQENILEGESPLPEDEEPQWEDDVDEDDYYDEGQDDDDEDLPRKKTVATQTRKRGRNSNTDGCPHCAELEQENEDLRKQLKILKSSASKGGGDNSGFPLQPKSTAAEDAALLHKVALKGINNQLKWKPTAKEGRAKWSWSGVSSFPGLLAALNLPSTTKLFKMKKMDSGTFSSNMGGIQARIRYGYLCITSPDVTIRFDSTTGEVTFSGSYGLPGSRKEKVHKSW